MRIWTTSETEMRRFDGTLKWLPPGTCLWVSDDQHGIRPGLLNVFGAGCYGPLAIDNVSLEPVQ